MNFSSGLSRLTQELHSFNSDIDSSQSNDFEYQSLSNKMNEHREYIQTISRKCIGNPLLFAELQTYSIQLKTTRSLLPPLKVLGNKEMIAAHLKILSIRKKLNEVQLIHKLSIAFLLSEDTIRELIGNPSEGFFAKAASVCFELANKRLIRSTPLSVEEVAAIYEALFDSTIKPFRERELNLNHWNSPHPTYVFSSLHRFLTRIESFESCDEMLEDVEAYLKKKPAMTDDVARFLRMPKSSQRQVLEVMKKEANKGSLEHQFFLNHLEHYQTKLFSFKDGIKRFPLVDVRNIKEETRHNNQTYFLNVDGRTHWVFKPISENKKGEEMVKAECTMSRLNYHRQFPIPLTVLLEIKEWVGSAQIFIEDTYTQAQIESEQLVMEEDPLHRLAICDLLFSNSDRNGANFLFQNLNGLASIVGIDHDSCLMFKAIRALRLEYLQFPAFENPLNVEMAELFSPAAIKHYKLIMEENGVPPFQFDWLDHVANQLQQALEGQKPFRDVIESLQSQYEDYFLRD